MEIFKQKENLLIFQSCFLKHRFQVYFETIHVIPNAHLGRYNFRSESSSNGFDCGFPSVACWSDEDKRAGSCRQDSFAVSHGWKKFWDENDVLWTLAFIDWKCKAKIGKLKNSYQIGIQF